MTNKAAQKWGKLQEEIYTGLTQCYPTPKAHEIQQRKQQNQQNQHKQWGTPSECTEMNTWKKKN